MTLYRILIETHHKPLISRYSEWYRRGAEPAWQRHDVVVWATDDREARRVALDHLSTTGDKRRVVRESLVPVVLDHPRVVMQHEVTW